jgi:hypothetical protein
VFVQAGQPTINAQGDVAFDGLATACGLRPGSGCGGGVYGSRAIGELERIVGPEDPAPDGRAGRVRRATGPVINDRGEIAYVAELEELPHGSRLASLGRGAAGGRPFWALNDRGDLAFVATLTDAIFADGGGSNGVYAFRDGRLRLVARSGTPVLGLGTIRAIGTFVRGVPEQGPPLLLTGGVALDDDGAVVFPATLTDGRVLLLRGKL